MGRGTGACTGLAGPSGEGPTLHPGPLSPALLTPWTLHPRLCSLLCLPEASALAPEDRPTQAPASCSRRDPLGHSHLDTGARRPCPLTSRGSLVVEDNVRPPDELRGNADGGDILVVRGVPTQLVVIPFLGQGGRRKPQPASEGEEGTEQGRTPGSGSPHSPASPTHSLSSSGSSHPGTQRRRTAVTSWGTDAFGRVRARAYVSLPRSLLALSFLAHEDRPEMDMGSR